MLHRQQTLNKEYSGDTPRVMYYCRVVQQECRAAGAMTVDEERELLSMTRLAPGDFHTVRARCRLTDPGGVTHAVLTADLRREQSMKPAQAGRRIGF
jgi:hypothetical protein